MNYSHKLLYYIIGSFFLLASPIFSQSTIYVGTKGRDTNNGTIGNPVRSLTAARDRARATGAKQILIRGGVYSYDQTCVLNNKDSGLRIAPYNNEKVVFDGAKFVDPKRFKKVQGGATSRLHSKAVGRVFVQKINDKELIDLFSKPVSHISMNGRPMHISRFPNQGYSLIDFNSVSGDQPRAEGNANSAKGPQFKVIDRIDAKKWNAELKRNKRAFARGYYSADWLQETNPIFSVSSSGLIRLQNGTRYGIKTEGGTRRKDAINRIYMMQLLCELDEPGEWYFDPKDNNLYIWPYTSITATTRIGAWNGKELIRVNNASTIRIERITIQNLGKGKNGEGAITFNNTTSSEMAGITFKNIATPLSPANVTGGSRSGIKSCDFIDTERASRLVGGKIKTGEVVLARNYVENCHFTQIYSRDFYGKAIGINGAGNIFRNNLVHNINGQPITHGGQEHLIEKNEIFNTGIEEGDGGAIYTGANYWSFGTRIRQNFIHHLMSIPQHYGKQGIYCDDNDGGDLLEDNFFYKGGMHAILTNGGPGHSVFNNVIAEANIAIRSGSGKGNETYKINMNYIRTNPKDKIKANYVGRMLQYCGRPGWENGLNENNWIQRIDPFWTKRYPGFKVSMEKMFKSKENRPFESRWYGNIVAKARKNFENPSQVNIRDTKNVSQNEFVDVNRLNLQLRNPKKLGVKAVNFNEIGLYKDKYRCAIPNKDSYRRAVKNHFSPWQVHTRDKYDHRTINKRLYFNTGQLVWSTVPCGDTVDPVADVSEYRFDLGTDTSPVQNGYIRITPRTQTQNYGWALNNDIFSADRGAGRGNRINQDLIYSAIPRTFNTRVSNGNWKVTLTFGDKFSRHDNMRVQAEGKTQLSNINSAFDFFNREFVTEVKDGQLNLKFFDDGGKDKNWALTRIWLRKTNESATSTPSVNQNVLADGVYHIMAKHSRQYLEVANGNKNNGGIVQQWSANNRDNQRWELRHIGKGYYTMKVMHSGRFLDIKESNKNKGAIVQVWGSQGKTEIHRHFKLIPRKDGYFSIQARHSGYCFDVIRNSKERGTDLELWDCSERDNKLFRFIPAKGKKEPDIPAQLSAYPNPARDYFNIQLTSPIEDPTWYTLTDRTGRIVKKGTISEQNSKVSMAGLASGLYFLEVRGGVDFVTSIIKE